MKEGILLAGNASTSVRWAGPGNKKILKGDTELGYFGIITSNELFGRKQFSDLVGIAALLGDDVVGVEGWYKFILNGKRIIYISRSPIVNNITWVDIYDKGLMYGEKGEGPVPIIDVGREQFIFVNKREYLKDEERIHNWFLKPRTLTGYNELVSDTIDDDLSDWELLRRVFSSDLGGTEEFEKDGIDLYGAGKHLLANRDNSGIQARIRGGDDLLDVSETSLHSKDHKYLWRPVLELVVDGTVAYPPELITWDTWSKTSVKETLLVKADRGSTLIPFRLTAAKSSARTGGDVTTENVLRDVKAESFVGEGKPIYLETISGMVPVALDTWESDGLLLEDTYTLSKLDVDVWSLSKVKVENVVSGSIDKSINRLTTIHHQTDVTETVDVFKVSNNPVMVLHESRGFSESLAINVNTI